MPELRIKLCGVRAEELANELVTKGMAASSNFDGEGYILDCGEMALPPGANESDEQQMRAWADAIAEGIRGLAFDMGVKVEVL